ncbi:MAG: lipid-A-disaccharide synthase [Paludibacteraceae bacterium]|nr:lipid-A-disaccharide synthase [Paludibacteraceae bacterium]
MKYFIIAGEASGDLHGSNLMKALRAKDSQALFVGFGGDKMRAEGCDIRIDYREMAYMGFVAVIANLHKVRRNMCIAKQSLLSEKPDILILIDYPSFNLRIAQFCREHLPDTRIVYYIPPKIWAWKEWRVHQIAKYSDEILGIFPFEPAFYAKHGYKCQYVGNPTVECINEFITKNLELTTQENDLKIQNSKFIIVLLPGSRPSEISRCLPIMLAAARNVANDKYQIVVGAAPGIEDDFYQPYLNNEILIRNPYATLAQAQAAIVNSGTATLETALIGCPQTAVYHITGSKYLEWLIKPILFRIKHFTLVNIIANQEVIQELVGKRFTQINIENELRRLLNDEPYRRHMQQQYADIKTILGDESAAHNAAKTIFIKQ